MFGLVLGVLKCVFVCVFLMCMKVWMMLLSEVIC